MLSKHLKIILSIAMCLVLINFSGNDAHSSGEDISYFALLHTTRSDGAQSAEIDLRIGFLIQGLEVLVPSSKGLTILDTRSKIQKFHMGIFTNRFLVLMKESTPSQLRIQRGTVLIDLIIIQGCMKLLSLIQMLFTMCYQGIITFSTGLM